MYSETQFDRPCFARQNSANLFFTRQYQIRILVVFAQESANWFGIGFQKSRMFDGDSYVRSCVLSSISLRGGCEILWSTRNIGHWQFLQIAYTWLITVKNLMKSPRSSCFWFYQKGNMFPSRGWSFSHHASFQSNGLHKISWVTDRNDRRSRRSTVNVIYAKKLLLTLLKQFLPFPKATDLGCSSGGDILGPFFSARVRFPAVSFFANVAVLFNVSQISQFIQFSHFS